MNITKLTENLKYYMNLQLDSMSRSTPIMGIMKPLITRALDKNFNKVIKAFNLVADDNGNIDVQGIASEMIDNIMRTDPFKFNIPLLGDVELGGGKIEFNIPLTNKKLVLNDSDLNNFKSIITKEA